MSTSARRPAAAGSPTTPPTVVRITLGVILAIIVAMVACSQVAPSSRADGPAPADVLPAGFPVPADAQVVGQAVEQPAAGVVTLSVPATPDELIAFYEEHLPESGWTTDPWEGTNPFGQPAQGLVITKDGDEGALSITQAEDGRATVEINLVQPVSPTEGGAGMGGMHGEGS